jgi:aryl-alcohol dehydrogenase-like predicted oxidoreductase
MRYRRLGNSGLKVSVVGLGGNTFGRFIDAAETARVVHAALDGGVNFFDTAEAYGLGTSEQYLGRALADRRHDAVIATKTGWQVGKGPNDRGASRRRILDAVHASLRHLGTDYIDVYLIHRWDYQTPIEETLSTLDNLVHQGKVRYVGCSNFAAWQLVSAMWTSDRRGWTPFVATQAEYSLLYRDVEVELLPACEAFGVGMIPYFPLAGGVLTGKYRAGQAAPVGTRGEGNQRFENLFLAPRNLEIVPKTDAWARARGHTVAELAIAWLIAQPTVSSVIAGTTKLHQLQENLRAAHWALTPAEAEEVGALAPVVLSPQMYLRSVAPESS